jgi:hexosaminidase
MTKPIGISCVATLLLAAGVAHADAGPDIIPRPAAADARPGQFTLSDHTAICIDDPALRDTAEVLVDLLAKPMGAPLALTVVHGDAPAGAVLLTRKGADPSLGQEGYHLSVTPGGVVIRAATTAGLFYGVQSLRQMLPPQVESQDKVSGVAWTLPCVEIADAPRCRWRGLMLDCARHFFDTGEVERMLDVMALHKLNVFHWHLTDDQGWRIEIKRYPKLTEQAAWRDGIGFGLDPKRSTHYRASDGKYGGFYTQADVRDVVAYAAARHIIVVPEIEMPGHSSAALAAYPEFATGGHAEATNGAGVFSGIYDPANEGTFTFLDNVLTEVAGLFPGPYIHIGGDEVPKGPWKKAADCQALMRKLGLTNEDQLQSYFIKRVERIVASKGKRMIGWDEILEGGLAPGALVMSWHGTGKAVTSAKDGHDVILDPAGSTYLCYSQTRAKGQPPTARAFLPLPKVYELDPVPAGLSTEQARHVLGAQGALWSEWVPNLKQAELMSFPRELAIAEAAWTPHDRTDFADFQRRLDADEKRLDVMGITYFHEDAATGPAPVGK